MKWLIIDGNNLLYQLKPGWQGCPADKQQRRVFLLQMLDNLGAALAQRVTVVFDGGRFSLSDKEQKPAAEQAGQLEIIFSPAGGTADSVIERLVCAAPDTDGITVVTSDRAEMHVVVAAGAEVVSCQSFLEQMESTRTNITGSLARRSSRRPGFTLGDSFPADS